MFSNFVSPSPRKAILRTNQPSYSSLSPHINNTLYSNVQSTSNTPVVNDEYNDDNSKYASI